MPVPPNLRHGKEIFLVPRIQVSFVQRFMFESRKFRLDKTNIVKILKKKILWYGNVSLSVGTRLDAFNKGKAFLGASSTFFFFISKNGLLLNQKFTQTEKIYLVECKFLDLRAKSR